MKDLIICIIIAIAIGLAVGLIGNYFFEVNSGVIAAIASSATVIATRGIKRKSRSKNNDESEQ